jgi:hypothetical protein
MGYGEQSSYSVCVDAFAERARQGEILVLLCRRMVRVLGAQAATRLWQRPIPALPRAAVALSSFRLWLFLEHAPRSPRTPHTPHTPTSSSTSIACKPSSTICAPPAVILHLTARALGSQCLFIITHSTRSQRVFHPGLGPLHSLPVSPTARPFLQFASVLATHPVGCQSCHRPTACSHSHYVGTDAYSSPLLADGHLLSSIRHAPPLYPKCSRLFPEPCSWANSTVISIVWSSPLSSELILHLGSPCRPTCVCLLHCRHP